MAEHSTDLWRDFPKTAIEFDEQFQTEEDCRAYWIEARWGGMRIPVIATGYSGASRPCVPIDRDQLEGGGLSAAG